MSKAKLGFCVVALGLALLATPTAGQQPQELPDLIVADAYLERNDLVLEIQNQGPGAAKKGATVTARIGGRLRNKPVEVDLTVPAPDEVFAVSHVRIPLAKFGVTDPNHFDQYLTVQLDPANQFADARRDNNTYHKILGPKTNSDRGDYQRQRNLPDLVINDITCNGGSIFVHYQNRGRGVTGADFLVELSGNKRKFEGNYLYRFTVPPPGKAMSTGGFSPDLLALNIGDEVEITARIDPEQRVRESNDRNNTFTKKIKIVGR
jgi:hypothetical protein